MDVSKTNKQDMSLDNAPSLFSKNKRPRNDTAGTHTGAVSGLPSPTDSTIASHSVYCCRFGPAGQ